jgi:hypothetical protein
MQTFDFAPFTRSSIGFDRLFDLLDAASHGDSGESGYPPYNIEKAGLHGRPRGQQSGEALIHDGGLGAGWLQWGASGHVSGPRDETPAADRPFRSRQRVPSARFSARQPPVSFRSTEWLPQLRLPSRSALARHESRCRAQRGPSGVARPRGLPIPEGSVSNCSPGRWEHFSAAPPSGIPDPAFFGSSCSATAGLRGSCVLAPPRLDEALERRQ